MQLLVGLGNPGPKYALTRHNIGFLVVDAIASHMAAGKAPKTECQSLTYKIQVKGEDVLLVKPQTFMNLSGAAVQGLMTFYKITPDKILVMHDEVDIAYGKIRFQKNRGHGGHNGIRDIHAKIGGDYSRLKIGVGRPVIPQMEVADWVLQNFGPEKDTLSEFVGRAADAAVSFIEDGFLKAQNRYNTES